MNRITANFSGDVTRRHWNNREYLVAPAVLVRADSVLNGSRGPLLYPARELRKSVQAWENMPLTLGHPKEDGRPISAHKKGVLANYQLGLVRHPKIRSRDGSLVAQVWFDEELTAEKSPELLERLEAGEKIELSTGLRTNNIPATGIAKGRHYDFIATEHDPDHLAILLAETGACSLDDGCGILANCVGDDGCKCEKCADVAELVAYLQPRRPVGKDRFIHTENFEQEAETDEPALKLVCNSRLNGPLIPRHWFDNLNEFVNSPRPISSQPKRVTTMNERLRGPLIPPPMFETNDDQLAKAQKMKRKKLRRRLDEPLDPSRAECECHEREPKRKKLKGIGMALARHRYATGQIVRTPAEVDEAYGPVGNEDYEEYDEGYDDEGTGGAPLVSPQIDFKKLSSLKTMQARTGPSRNDA
jgi:hypothetical protein